MQRIRDGSQVDYERAPLSLVLKRYLLPFWLFRDASRGDRLTRAAAYRHNRSMRGYLPGYIRRWTVQAALALGLVFVFDAQATSRATLGGPDLSVVLTAGAGIAFACCLCMLFVMGYAYLYLSRHE